MSMGDPTGTEFHKDEADDKLAKLVAMLIVHWGRAPTEEEVLAFINGSDVERQVMHSRIRREMRALHANRSEQGSA
jgi:hypothetical protein